MNSDGIIQIIYALTPPFICVVTGWIFFSLDKRYMTKQQFADFQKAFEQQENEYRERASLDRTELLTRLDRIEARVIEIIANGRKRTK